MTQTLPGRVGSAETGRRSNSIILKMRSFLKFLSRNKLYSLINLLGLSVSMAFVILLAVYVRRQLGTDAFQQNADRIYVIANQENVNAAYWLDKHLKNRFPEIEKSTAFTALGEGQEFRIDGEKVYGSATCVDSSFFEIFSFDLAEGSKAGWKVSADRCMVSEDFARAHFGDKSPLGRQIILNNNKEYSLTVCGVFKDFGNSVLKSPDVLLRGEVCTWVNSSNDERMSNAGSSTCFVMTHPGADLQARKADMLSYLQEIYWVYQYRDYNEVRIIPLRDLYFLSHAKEDYNAALHFGDRSLVRLLMTLCILLLLFAVLNYVNMTTALTGFRAKEMATRRLLGAGKGGIFLKIIGESVLVCAVAMLFALLLAEALSPPASRMLGYRLPVLASLNPVTLPALAGFVLLVGLLAGFIPAAIIQQVQPIEIVRGMLRRKTKTVYSKVIIVIQNVIAVAMLVAALTMFLQVRALIGAPLGYDTKDILNIDNSFGKASALTAMLDKFRSDPCVEAVGLGNGTPFKGTNNWTMELAEASWCSFQMIQGDSAYFRILDLRKKQDNHNPGHYWLNEQAFRQIGIDESATEFQARNTSNPTIEIGGVYYDFRIWSILENSSAALIYNYGTYPPEKYPWNILVKTSGDHGQARKRLAEIAAAFFPDTLFDAEYLEDSIRARFAEQTRLLRIVSIFALLSLLVAALGLFAMSSYYLQQERRTVALKKVYGADYGGVLRELVFSFLKMIGVSFAIAVPLAWLVMRKWLDSFSYRIGLHAWIFLAAGLAVALLAALAVLWQSIRAARTNPAETLKKE